MLDLTSVLQSGAGLKHFFPFVPAPSLHAADLSAGEGREGVWGPASGWGCGQGPGGCAGVCSSPFPKGLLPPRGASPRRAAAPLPPRKQPRTLPGGRARRLEPPLASPGAVPGGGCGRPGPAPAAPGPRGSPPGAGGERNKEPRARPGGGTGEQRARWGRREGDEAAAGISTGGGEAKPSPPPAPPPAHGALQPSRSIGGTGRRAPSVLGRRREGALRFFWGLFLCLFFPLSREGTAPAAAGRARRGARRARAVPSRAGCRWSGGKWCCCSALSS